MTEIETTILYRQHLNVGSMRNLPMSPSMDKSTTALEQKRPETGQVEEPIRTESRVETRTSNQRERLVNSTSRSRLPALCGWRRYFFMVT
jgi:hypothetical protein